MIRLALMRHPVCTEEGFKLPSNYSYGLMKADDNIPDEWYQEVGCCVVETDEETANKLIQAMRATIEMQSWIDMEWRKKTPQSIIVAQNNTKLNI